MLESESRANEPKKTRRTCLHPIHITLLDIPGIHQEASGDLMAKKSNCFRYLKIRVLFPDLLNCKGKILMTTTHAPFLLYSDLFDGDFFSKASRIQGKQDEGNCVSLHSIPSV